MKITSLWAAVALLRASTVLAQDQPSGTSTSPASTTSAAPTCTASEITKLCDYKMPVIAAAIESRASCWEYCNEHQPCSFVVFAAGNPYTGSGTCWLYPGEDFDKSAGNTDCGNPYLTVYSKPECSGGTPTSGGCEATASPSAIATICGYPTPPDDCFYTCTASDGAVNCLSQCAKSDSCSYAVFNPRNEQNSPYLGGTCWMYPNGTYDAGLAGKCDGEPEQWVYNNVCPKPSPSSASSSQPSPSASATGGSGGSGGSGSAGAGQDITTTRSEGLAPTGFPIANPLAVGVAVLLWQGL